MKSSLFKSTQQARRVILGVLIFVIAVIAGDTFIKFANSAQNPFNQLPSFYEQPSSFVSNSVPDETVLIPSLEISSESTPSFTVEGSFPTFPDAVRFYSVTRPRQLLDTVPTAEAIARKLGFTAYSDISTEEMQWQNNRLTKTLTFDKVDQIWQLRTQYFQDAQALMPKELLETEAEYANKAGSFLSQIGFTNSTLTTGRAVAKFSRLGSDGLFTNPLTGAQADYVNISMYRKLPLARVLAKSQQPAVLQTLTPPADYDGFVYATDPRLGSFNFVVSDRMQDTAKDMYAFDFVNYDYNALNYSIEYVLTPAQAWDLVQAGKGALTLLKPRGSDYFAGSQKLTVTKFAADAAQTELAYWEPDEWTGFIYPIYIFRGRAELADGKSVDFVFYVDAFRRVDDPRN